MYRVKYNRCIQGWFRRGQSYERNAYIYIYISYNPPGYSIGRHVFLSGILSFLSGGTVNLLTLVTMNIIYINSRF